MSRASGSKKSEPGRIQPKLHWRSVERHVCQGSGHTTDSTRLDNQFERPATRRRVALRKCATGSASAAVQLVWQRAHPARRDRQISDLPFPIFTHNTAERQDSPKHWQSQWHTVNGRGISVILSCIRSNFARNFPVNSRPQRTFPTISAAEFTSEIRKKSKKPGHGKNRFRIEEPRGRTQARAAMRGKSKK